MPRSREREEVFSPRMFVETEDIQHAYSQEIEVTAWKAAPKLSL